MRVRHVYFHQVFAWTEVLVKPRHLNTSLGVCFQASNLPLPCLKPTGEILLILLFIIAYIGFVWTKRLKHNEKSNMSYIMMLVCWCVLRDLSKQTCIEQMWSFAVGRPTANKHGKLSTRLKKKLFLIPGYHSWEKGYGVEGWKKSTNGFPMISVSDNIKSLAGSEGVRVCWSRDPRWKNYRLEVTWGGISRRN